MKKRFLLITACLIFSASSSLASTDYHYCNRFLQEQSLFSIAMIDGKLTSFTARDDVTSWQGANEFGSSVKVEIRYRLATSLSTIGATQATASALATAKLASRVDIGEIPPQPKNSVLDASSDLQTRVLRAFKTSPNSYRLSTTDSNGEVKTFNMQVRNGACFPVKGETAQRTLFDTEVCRQLDDTLAGGPKITNCQCGDKDTNERLTAILNKWGRFENPKFEFESSLLKGAPPSVALSVNGTSTHSAGPVDPSNIGDLVILRAMGALDQCARFSAVAESASDPRFRATSPTKQSGVSN